ncbi:MAG: DUF1549 domain-containing protein, partial [Opitutaceae bacterium]|nr:DUF1549 domain-containing protein [Opitutaceae bacterium]
MKTLALHLTLSACAAAVSSAATVDVAKLPPAATRPVDFARDVRPVLEQSCHSCHGPKKQSSGYRLDLKVSALTGGEGSAPNIRPGQSAASPLIHYVAGLVEDMLMPSKGDTLTPDQIGVLRAWIDQGAAWPDDGRATAEPDEWKTHWSFRPLARPEVPRDPAAPSQSPIDAFVTAKLKEHGLALSPPADARTLIRRLSFDLTGLPPTPAEVDAFVADRSPDAYARLVDRLLASPRYGERWARHWLDVVKFAESDGFERNNLRPNAWPYRDYVIRALNDDVPYDRFVREQIAGDALGADAATGFIVGGSFDFLQSFEPPYFNAVQRADELYEIVGTTGSAFLGLTVGCARCHDHKFDPISAADYYSMVAVFQGVEHGERPMRPRNHAELEAAATAPRQRLAALDTQLAPFAVRPQPRRIIVLNPHTSGKAIPYSPGKARGQASDPGDELRLPTLNAGFQPRPSTSDAGRWQPWETPPSGRYRVWISWGVSADHAQSVRVTLDDAEIAHVDQTRFADGGPAVTGEKRWSGFSDAGIHTLTASSRFALRSEPAGGMCSADALLLEEISGPADEAPTHAPHLRSPVVVKTNEERFAPVDAKFLRFTVLGSNTPEGYIDELEVFAAGGSPRNVALAEFGAVATSPTVNGENGNPFYVNDRRYNERAAWNSPAKAPGYVQLEFAKTERIDRILWSRNRSDRQPNLDDHLITNYRIEVSLDGQAWT